MRGILSNAPAPSSIRPLVGSQLLLLIQAGLVMASQPPLDPALSLLVLIVSATALAALVGAIAGESGSTPHYRGSRRHDG